MKKLFASLFAITLLSTVAIGYTCAKNLTSGSEWVNENGSVMKITESLPNGQFNGTFTTAVGCGVGKPRPLTGFGNNGSVTFTVNFQECNSATSWAGNITSEGAINTLWNLSQSGPSQWNSIIAGSDTFTVKTSDKHQAHAE